MSKDRWRVSADVPHDTRGRLLRMFPPKFRKVYALSVTWAYGVAGDFAFNGAMQDCTLYGYHEDEVSQALLASIAGQRTRPLGNGQLLFLTLSVADPMEPARAGAIELDRVTYLDHPVTFGTRLVRHPLWQHKPKRNTSAFAA
jgi:hypothetical protein